MPTIFIRPTLTWMQCHGTLLIAQLVMLLEALLSCVRHRTTWPLTLAIHTLRGNQYQTRSLATYAAEPNESKLTMPKPFWRSIPMASHTLVDCPECDGEGTCLTLTAGAASINSGIPINRRRCGSCDGAGRVERQKRTELLQRQVRLIASVEPATAEFIGGPLDGQLQQLSEPLPSFTWAHALPDDWTSFRDNDQYEDVPVELHEYTYERQGYYSSRGNAVYLCTEDGSD